MLDLTRKIDVAIKFKYKNNEDKDMTFTRYGVISAKIIELRTKMSKELSLNIIKNEKTGESTYSTDTVKSLENKIRIETIKCFMGDQWNDYLEALQVSQMENLINDYCYGIIEDAIDHVILDKMDSEDTKK